MGIGWSRGSGGGGGSTTRPPFLEVRVLLGGPGRLDEGEGDHDQDDDGNVVTVQQALITAIVNKSLNKNLKSKY